MFGMDLTRLEAEVIGGLIIVAAVLLWLGFHDAKVANEATAPVVAQIQAAQAAAGAADATKAAQVASDQRDNLREAQSQNEARLADARAIAADVQRMHDDAIRSRAALAAASAAGSSQAASMPATGMVSADMYARALAARADAESDAAALAATVDCLRTSGQLCAADYAALK